MGLLPIEYIDCFVDSPNFRDIIAIYEKELESNSQVVMNLVKECRNMINATEEFSKAQLAFANCLGNFSFQTIGEQTDDEKMIVGFLHTSSRLLLGIEDFRHNMISTISVRLLQNLENFRNDQIKKAKDEKKKFDKASQSYYSVLDRYLSTSSKKKEMVLAEADSVIEVEHANYRQAAFQYVCKLQDVHSQKKFELMEPIIGYIGDVSTFIHQAYDNAHSTKLEQRAVQLRVQIVRETYEMEQEKTYQLKAQIIEDGITGMIHHPEFFRQGHLFIQDSGKKKSSTWHRYFCQFRKKEFGRRKVRQARFLPIGHQGRIPTQDFVEVKDCVRSNSEECERRFCFEVELVTSIGNKRYTIQGTSMEDRKSWLEVMEGKEPVYYSSPKVLEVGNGIPNKLGYDFLSKCITEIEDRGLYEEGLYRKPGIISKASKLQKDCLEKGKLDNIDFTNVLEWDTNTIASAVKRYLSKHLEEPLLTFSFHSKFIEASKISDRDHRVEVIRDLVAQLPDANRDILCILIQHLSQVAKSSDFNLMKASNLGVMFGNSLMRPERESVATIVNIKYQNIVVEEMIDHVDIIFTSAKLPMKTQGGSPSVPKSSAGAPPIPSRTEAMEPDSKHRAVPDINHRQSSTRQKPAKLYLPDQSHPSRRGRSARALFDCDAEDDMELSFKKNDILHNVMESDEPDWMRARRENGKKGLVPVNYIELFP